MKVVLILIWTTALWATHEYFPVIGGSAQQTVTIRIIGLGTRDSWCMAAVGFRTLSGEQLGDTKEFAVRIGQSERHSLKLSDLGLADGERAEIRPVVELGTSLSVCWPAVEVSRHGVTDGYLSGTVLRMRRPADAKLSPFLDVNEGEAARVVVYRIDREDAPPCQLLAGFRRSDGEPIAQEETWTLGPGEARQMEHAPPGKERVLLNLRPAQESGGRLRGIGSDLRPQDRRHHQSRSNGTATNRRVVGDPASRCGGRCAACGATVGGPAHRTNRPDPVPTRIASTCNSRRQPANSGNDCNSGESCSTTLSSLPTALSPALLATTPPPVSAIRAGCRWE